MPAAVDAGGDSDAGGEGREPAPGRRESRVTRLLI